MQSLLLGVLTCVGSLVVPQPVSAQYFGNNFHGDFRVGYYLQAKLSDDSGDDVPVSALQASRGR
jgi:hypothetical protein